MILVLDSSVLNPFARAGRLADLQRLTDGFDHVTTRAVLDELARGVAEYPALAAIPQQPWLRTVASDSLAELVAFSEYVRVLGGSSRNIGESSVLAHAEIHGAVAFVDDDAAVSAGRTRGVTVTTVVGRGHPRRQSPALGPKRGDRAGGRSGPGRVERACRATARASRPGP
jgi:hypothetical protein